MYKRENCVIEFEDVFLKINNAFDTSYYIDFLINMQSVLL